MTNIDAGPYAAPPAVPSVDSHQVSGLNEAATDDETARAYATNAGVSLTTARTRITQENAMSAAMARRGIQPVTPTMDAWLDDSTGQLVLHVRSDDGASVAAMNAVAMEADLHVVVEALPAVVSSRTSHVSTHHTELAALLPGLIGYYVDTGSGKLVINVLRPPNVDPAQGELDRANFAKRAMEVVGLPVDIVYSDAPLRDTSTVTGGVALSNCTAAFTGRYTTGGATYDGFFTAAHCGTSLSYFYTAAASGTGRAATYMTRTWNGNADIAFFAVSTLDNTVGQFFGASATVGTVPSTEVCAAPGATVCSRGRDSGYRCGTVQSATYTPTADLCNGSTCAASFVSVSMSGQAGDSGGPVWVSGQNSPVGIFKASTGTGPNPLSIYSKLGFRPAGTSLK